MEKVQHMKKSLFVTVLSVALLSGTVSFAESSAKIGGFVDAQFNWRNTGKNNTFLINDGALYFSKEFDSTAFMIDLPFMFDSATNANFSFAETKPQAYVSHTYDFGLNWRLGQFDKLYGYEANDTIDIRYTKQGIVYSQMLPRVHTGLNLNYDLEPIHIGALVANPRDMGQMSDTASGTINIPDYGVTLGVKSEMAHLNFGFLQAQNTGGSTSFSLYDVILGVDYAGFSGDLEALFRKNANDTSSTGWLLDLAYDWEERFGVGARGEIVNRANGIHQISQVTVGPQVWMSKDMRMKLDYSYSATKVVSGVDATKGHAINIAGLYRF